MNIEEYITPFGARTAHRLRKAYQRMLCEGRDTEFPDDFPESALSLWKAIKVTAAKEYSMISSNRLDLRKPPPKRVKKPAPSVTGSSAAPSMEAQVVYSHYVKEKRVAASAVPDEPQTVEAEVVQKATDDSLSNALHGLHVYTPERAEGAAGQSGSSQMRGNAALWLARYRAVEDYWNERADGLFLKSRHIDLWVTPKFKEYWQKTGDIAVFKEAIDHCVYSPFFRENCKYGFRPSLEWLLKPKHFEKAINGGYDRVF